MSLKMSESCGTLNNFIDFAIQKASDYYDIMDKEKLYGIHTLDKMEKRRALRFYQQVKAANCTEDISEMKQDLKLVQYDLKTGVLIGIEQKHVDFNTPNSRGTYCQKVDLIQGEKPLYCKFNAMQDTAEQEQQEPLAIKFKFYKVV